MANVANILLVAGGSRPDPTAVQYFLASLPPVSAVVAVDSGLDHARALGMGVDAVVGDLDSVSDKGLEWAEREGVAVERHPADKDQTDLELAITRAAALAGEQSGAGIDHRTMLSVVAIDGDRSDHVLANLQVLGGPRTAPYVVRGLLDDSLLAVVGEGRAEESITITGRIGDRVSIHPFGGSASGLQTSGLRYPLDDETLDFGTARGVSNLLSDCMATVGVGRGSVVVLQELAVDRFGTVDEAPSGGEPDEPG